MDNEIQIRLKGTDVKPGLIRSKDIAEILEYIEDFVVYQALQTDNELKKEDIIVGLYQIEDKSIGLKFKTTYDAQASAIFAKLWKEKRRSSLIRSIQSECSYSLNIFVLI
jgi:hypothetical protein